MKNWDTNAEEALKHVQARYKSLSVYGSELAALVHDAGQPLPVSILSLYNQACNDYLSFANKVFSLLQQNKMRVNQVVLTNGQPSLDSKGEVRVVQIDAPLQPPFLAAQAGAVERIGQAPAPKVVVGIAPLLLGAYAVLGAIVVGVTGYVAVKVLREIRMFFQDGPDYDADKQLDAYTQCIAAAKAKGFSPQQIIESGCQKLLDPPPSSGTRWGTIALGVAAIGACAFVLPKFLAKD